MRFFLLALPLWLVAQAPTPPPIYPDSVPRPIGLWNRVADFSPRLRSVEACAFSPNGRLAVSGAKFGYGVMLWRVADGGLLWENAHESEVECVTFSPDGQRIASGGEDFTIRIWDVATGAPLYVIRTEEAGFDGITWSPDGRFILGGDEAGNVVFFDAATYREVARINCGSTVNSLHFSRDGKRLVVGGNVQTPDPAGPGGNRYTGFVRVIDVASRRIVVDVGELGGSVKSVRFAPDEATIAAGGFDQRLRLFDATSGRPLREIAEAHRIEAVAFSPDGRFLLTGGHGRAINFYRLADGALALRLPAARVEYLDFSADGRLLLAGHEDSGLLSCYLLESDTQARSDYQRLADEQLHNRDLQSRNR